MLHESQAVLTALREHQLHVHVVFLMCCTDQEEENELDRNFKKSTEVPMACLQSTNFYTGNDTGWLPQSHYHLAY